jgi:prepilin-type N-terminal cleavage/methylation domain-containing protein
MTHRTPIRRRIGGFTLVELLVVIGIIALLISILLPTLNRARQSAKEVVCLGQNLRSVGQTVNLFANDNDGFVPRNQGWANPGGPWWTSYMYLWDYASLIEAYDMSPQNFVCPSAIGRASGAIDDANRAEGPLLIINNGGFGYGVGGGTLNEVTAAMEADPETYPDDIYGVPKRNNWWGPGCSAFADFGSYQYMGWVPSAPDASRHNWEVVKISGATRYEDESRNSPSTTPLMGDRTRYTFSENRTVFNHGERWNITQFTVFDEQSGYDSTRLYPQVEVEVSRGDIRTGTLFLDGHAVMKTPEPVSWTTRGGGDTGFFY